MELQGVAGFEASATVTSTQLIADPDEFEEPSFESTQRLGKPEQKMDKHRGEKVVAENVSVWRQPNRTLLSGETDTTSIYNIFTGGYSILPCGEDHEGYYTMEERDFVNRSVTQHQGLRVSLEGNIGSGKGKNIF